MPHKVVALDTMVFIYYFEGKSVFVPKIEKTLKAIESGQIKGATTVITLSEILVKPLAEKNLDLADDYKNMINTFPNMKVLEINQYIATLAANLKASYGIRLPDALQIAGAITAGAEHFITNDQVLKKVKEISVVTLDKL